MFGHRLYAGITSAHFMAETVPLMDPEHRHHAVLRSDRREPAGVRRRAATGQQRTVFVKQLRNVVTFAQQPDRADGGSGRDTRDFVDDVATLEALAADLADLDDRELRSLILLARDHVVHGWVLASASIMVCAAYGVILRVLSGRDITALGGHRPRQRAVARRDAPAGRRRQGGRGVQRCSARRSRTSRRSASGHRHSTPCWSASWN